MSTFEKNVANIISYLFHPLLMPLIGYLIISHSGTYAASMDYRVQRYLSTVFLGMTFVLPAAFIPLYYYTRLIKSIQMTERRERIIPYYVTLIFYLIAFFLIKHIPVSSIYARFLLASCFTLFFVFVISFFWKISIHLAGLGGIIALILCLSILMKADLMVYLIILILISGVTAYARLRLDAHSPLQVYSGFLLGFGCVLFVFLF